MYHIYTGEKNRSWIFENAPRLVVAVLFDSLGLSEYSPDARLDVLSPLTISKACFELKCWRNSDNFRGLRLTESQNGVLGKK